MRKFVGAFGAFEGLDTIALGVETGIEIYETLKDGYDTITTLFSSNDDKNDDEDKENQLVSYPTPPMRVYAV